MSVPLFNLDKQTASIAEEFKTAFAKTLTTSQFINGPEVTAFEDEFAAYLGNTAGTVGVSSGTDALLVALMAEGIGPGDKVLLPAFTFFATAGSVARSGATPVFVDIDPVSFNISIDDLKKKYTPECKAIMPVHLYGQSADMGSIMTFAQENNMVVIEDVAQAMGAKYNNQQAGTLGEWGCFSFFPTKNMGALGDAGAVCANTEERVKKAKQTRNHGDVSRYEHAFVGGNFRLDAIQASFLRIKLPQANGYIEARRNNAAYYAKALGSIEYIELPQEMPNCYHTYNQFTIRVKDGQRDALREHLNDNGIGNQVYYPIPLQRQKCFEGNYSDCPNSDQACEEVISLPIYPELTQEQLDEVAAAVNSFKLSAV